MDSSCNEIPLDTDAQGDCCSRSNDWSLYNVLWYIYISWPAWHMIKFSILVIEIQYRDTQEGFIGDKTLLNRCTTPCWLRSVKPYYVTEPKWVKLDLRHYKRDCWLGSVTFSWWSTAEKNGHFSLSVTHFIRNKYNSMTRICCMLSYKGILCWRLAFKAKLFLEIDQLNMY